MRKPAALLKSVSLFGAAAVLGCGCSLFSAPSVSHSDASAPLPDVSIVINGLDMPYPEGMDENDNPYLDYIESHTGLDVDVLLPPLDVYEDKLNAIMASGVLPDLINVSNGVWVDNYVRQGALLPLDDLLESYGRNLLENIPEALWDQVRYEGEIYAIPSEYEVKGMELMYVRKDWLDRLGLAPPTTLDEYAEVIRAFAEDDPDGNGIDDTYGLILTEELGRSSPFFGAFGTQPDQWLERDGQLVYGGIVPETKEALAFLARLYAEGWLEPMFPLNQTANLAEQVEAGKIGLYSAAWYDTRGIIRNSKAHNPAAEWIALEYPVGPRGDSGVYATKPVRSYNVIPAGSDHPEAAVQFLDFTAGEGYETLKLGFENEVWRMENGRMKTDFKEHNKHQYRGIYQALTDYYNPELNEQRFDSLGEFHLTENLRIIERNIVPDAFVGLATPSMSRYMRELKELQTSVFDRIVLGLEPLDAFDEFVADWHAAGGAETTREVNEWYRAQKRGTGR